MITNLEDFKFHLLLQDVYIPSLEKLISNGEFKFKVGRKGTYALLEKPSRDNSSGTYVDKRGFTWSIEKI